MLKPMILDTDQLSEDWVLYYEDMNLRVAQLAKKMGITADTVRYYTRIGVLQPVKDKTNGYKNYCEQDEQKLRFALRAKQLGFTVTDIQQIIKHADGGKSPCTLVRKLLEKRLTKVESDFIETQHLYKRMKVALEKWQRLPDQEPTENIICALIKGWDKPNRKTKGVGVGKK